MSAGSQGRGTPEQGDDPFGYLYRPEGGQGGDGQPQAPQPPPSYHQVRPVGERSFGGQRGAGHGQQDAYYAAPETQPGGAHGGGRGGHGGHGGRGRGDAGPPKRNGLLIGAIAVVAAVVVGVGAAVIFSNGDNDDSNQSQEDPPAGPTGDQQDEDTNPEEEDPGDEEEDEDGDPDAELPTADITDPGEVTLSAGAVLESNIPGARSGSGAYVGGMNNHNATVSWTIDFQGEPGQYYFNMGYTVKGDQSLSFAVNSEIRNDKIDAKDFNGPHIEDSDGLDKRWTRTWKLVDLEPGENTFHIGCTTGDKCDVYIDKLWITDEQVTG
ncbi:carbohydrate-binding protein [Streptomyces sp. NPDC059853]|uniref:carbohydrate-binding protein n=1 Tax=Streptomyces sp. NPDC059853 TaxID=3346973 RepID=UPI0036519CDC